MGDLLAILPTDKIPPSDSELQAFSLLYGEWKGPSTKPTAAEAVEEGYEPRTEDRSARLPASTTTKSRVGTDSNDKMDWNTLALIVTMFAVLTLRPFMDWVASLFPFLQRVPLAFWALKVFVFGAYVFLLTNWDCIRVRR